MDDVVDDLIEVVVKQGVAFVGEEVECGVRDGACLERPTCDQHVAISVAVPNVDVHLDVLEPEPPRT